MFLTSGSTVAPDHHATDGAIMGEGTGVAELASRVRSAFPVLQFSVATLEERGGDHRMLLLDATYAFRFPRDAARDLGLEIAVLNALRGLCEIAVPEYEFVDPAKRFAGYRIIAGDELTPGRFASLPIEIRNRVLDQAGRFLATLHALAPERILATARWPRLASAAEQIAQARARQLPKIAARFPQLAGLLDAFYESCANRAESRAVVLHCDLVDDHLLLEPDRQQLAGIIDFGDAALGDPAQDFLGFWAYGADAVVRVMAAYGADADFELRERSRRAFVCYRINRFADLLAAGGVMSPRLVVDLTSLVSAELNASPTVSHE